MSNDYDDEYTVKRLRQDVPNLLQTELADLVDAYPTYRIKNFRMAYVDGIKRNLDNYQITEEVVAAKEQDFDQIRTTPRGGGELGKTGKKLKRAAMRLLFLRYKKEGHKAAQARAYVRNNHFPELSLRTIQDHLQDKSKKRRTTK
jgi:hypothetical protein